MKGKRFFSAFIFFQKGRFEGFLYTLEFPVIGEVNDFRVPISKIEDRTDLPFHSLSNHGAFKVSVEREQAQSILINSFADIVLKWTGNI